MTEQEYIAITKKVKLNSAMQLLGDLASYATSIDDEDLISAMHLLNAYHSKLNVSVEGK